MKKKYFDDLQHLWNHNIFQAYHLENISNFQHKTQLFGHFNLYFYFGTAIKQEDKTL